jgi:hypothetical protein
MLPGTAFSHHAALHRLSLEINYIETQYLQHLRTLLEFPDDQCPYLLDNHSPIFDRAFDVREGASLEGPELVRSLIYLRELRDNIRQRLFVNDLCAAEDQLEIAEATKNDLNDELENLATEFYHVIGDMGGLLFAQPLGQGIPRSSADSPAKWEILHSFLARWPENRSALEMGFYNSPDEIVSQFLENDEDEVLLWDLLYDAEPSTAPPSPSMLDGPWSIRRRPSPANGRTRRPPSEGGHPDAVTPSTTIGSSRVIWLWPPGPYGGRPS